MTKAEASVFEINENLFRISFFIIAIPFFISIVKIKQRNSVILAISLIVVFLLMALRNPSVGSDIAGYKRMYDTMVLQPWSNYDIYWTEWGYEFLTMVFTHVFHAPFQVFMACVYAFVYYSYYRFFKRYSEGFTTSILLYICFTFLNFDMSALRTTIALAICLFAVPYAEKKGLYSFFIFSLITFTAAQIHKSAYIFFAAYFIIRLKITITTLVLYIGIPMLLLLFRSQIYEITNMYFKPVQEQAISLGGQPNSLYYLHIDDSVRMVTNTKIWKQKLG